MRLQDLEVAAAVLERALGDEHFAALQREIGVQASYRMTEAQAEAVVRMQLGPAGRPGARRDRQGVQRPARARSSATKQLLGSEQNILDVIRKRPDRDARQVRRRPHAPRSPARSAASTIEDLIAEEDNAVTISHNGYIKRLPLNTYRSQHRGGKGVSGGGPREDDFIEHFFVASTHAYLLCFTNRGQLYWLKVYDIPQQSRTSPGRAIANVLSLKAGGEDHQRHPGAALRRRRVTCSWPRAAAW